MSHSSVGGYCTLCVGSCDWVLCSNAIKVSLNHSFSKQQCMKLMQIYGRGMWVILDVTFSQTLAKSSGSKADYCNLSCPSCHAYANTAQAIWHWFGLFRFPSVYSQCHMVFLMMLQKQTNKQKKTLPSHFTMKKKIEMHVSNCFKCLV